MPITQSAKKALRQSAARREKNVKRKKALKDVIKEYRKLSVSKKEEAQKMLPTVFKALDKAAKVNLIKKNKASRLKSRLAQKVA